MTDRISPKVFHEADGTEDWRVIGDGACAHFRTGSFAASARLVQAISELPSVEDHRPDVDMRADGVTVRLITVEGDYYGMGRRDIELARRISGVARELGLSADPSAVVRDDQPSLVNRTTPMRPLSAPLPAARR